VDVITHFRSDTATSELGKPGECAFDDPAIDIQATAVLGVSFCQHRLDAAAAKLPAMRFRILAAVFQNTVGFLSWSAWLPADWQDVIYHVFGVIHIRSSQDGRQRHALTLGHDVMLATGLGPIRGIGA
jgi:hypothetical protein